MPRDPPVTKATLPASLPAVEGDECADAVMVFLLCDVSFCTLQYKCNSGPESRQGNFLLFGINFITNCICLHIFLFHPFLSKAHTQRARRLLPSASASFDLKRMSL
jgi:hypothetical protein